MRPLGSRPYSSLSKQRPNPILFHRHMQIAAGDRHVGMANRVAHLGQCPPTGQGMADERMPAVVNGQMFQSLLAQHPARRPKALP